MISKSCEECKGVNSCNEYCKYHTTKAILTYIEGVDMVDLNIGMESTSRIRGKQEKLIVTGCKMYDKMESTTILKPAVNIDISNNNSPRITSPFDGGDLEKEIRESIEGLGVTEDRIEEDLKKINSLNRGTVAVNPFKPGMKCKILDKDVDSNGNIKIGKKKVDATIHYIRWDINNVTGMLQCSVAFKLGKGNGEDTGKTVYWGVEDYLEKFWINRVGSDSEPDSDQHAIKMNSQSIVMPIVVEDVNSKEKIIIDCRYMYKVNNEDETEIIAEWGQNGGLTSIGVIDSEKIKQYIGKNIKNIASHKRFIAPYRMVAENHIAV